VTSLDLLLGLRVQRVVAALDELFD
jgi:hypothetical protein